MKPKNFSLAKCPCCASTSICKVMITVLSGEIACLEDYFVYQLGFHRSLFVVYGNQIIFDVCLPLFLDMVAFPYPKGFNMEIELIKEGAAIHVSESEFVGLLLLSEPLLLCIMHVFAKGLF